ncbi:hypothetical protein DPMN_144190 [Dreissena polymorpha]|uniref:Uncharacterized protein n=1 Tax=Dreissena polymorpha TaxID=45954 RepID=A0A9D4JMC3_DREPO|nr:hypothetical protein DPMN_144190 [Dreissena polymorpha]
MRKIRKQKTGCTSGNRELLEPNNRKLTGVKKFLADKVKIKKSRRKFKNPFKHVKLTDERLVNEIYTVKVNEHIHQTKSNRPTQINTNCNWHNEPRDDVTSSIKMSDSGSQTPTLFVMTPGRRQLYSARVIRTDRRKSTRCCQADDRDGKRQRAYSCSARLGRNENSRMTLVDSTNNQEDIRESAPKCRRRYIFCCQ